MSNEERKGGWLRVLGIIAVTFLIAFLAFFTALEISLHRMMDPVYHAKRIEKMMRQEQRKLERFEDKMMDNPFEPKMQPMLVNLVKENDEYKVIVDLRPLGGNEKNIKVNLENNVISVFGNMERKKHKDKGEGAWKPCCVRQLHIKCWRGTRGKSDLPIPICS